jgi:hypothetical protein
MAATKPTKCSVTKTLDPDRLQDRLYKATVLKRVKKRVRVKGKWVTRTVVVKRTVTKTKQVPQAVTTTTTGDPEPCYDGATRTQKSGQTSTYWQDIHLTQDRAGASIDAVLPTSETNANCYGLQRIASIAQQFGAAPDDGQAIAQYAFDHIYPRYQGERPTTIRPTGRPIAARMARSISHRATASGHREPLLLYAAYDRASWNAANRSRYGWAFGNPG